MRIFLGLLSISLFISVLVAAEEKKDIEKTVQDMTWAIELSSNLGKLPPKPILFAVVKQDPMEHFKSQLQKLKPTWQKMKNQFNDKENTFPFVQIKISWDMIFKTVTGDDISVITEEESKKGQHSLSSNDFSEPQYLVTKALTDSKTVVYAWVVKLPLKKGQASVVTFSDANAINLKPIYDEIMNGK